MIKVCIVCEKEKDEEEFPLRSKLKGTRHNKCKKCQRAYSQEHYKKNKQKHNKRRYENCKIRRKELKSYIEQYKKNNPCVDCGEDDTIVLEFDHVRGTKEYNIADLISSISSLETVKKEIAKCEVRCANCHKRRHFKERQNIGE